MALRRWCPPCLRASDLCRTMALRTLKEEVNELLDLGFSHQQVFDQLVLQHPDAKPRRIAGLLQHRPSLAAKERYRHPHRALLALVAMSVLVRIWAVVDGHSMDTRPAWRLIGLVPFATLFMAYALYRWDGRHFQWVTWMNLVGAVGALRILSGLVVEGNRLTLGEAGSVISLAIGALALYLHNVAFPKYIFHKDPLGGPGRHEFKERFQEPWTGR